MPAPTSQQVIIGIVLVFGLATACQVIAPRLRVPALLLLLPAGFLMGLLAPSCRIDRVLGGAFPILVDFIVAVILFQGGMGLSKIPLHGRDRAVVRTLLWMGAPITALLAALAAHFLLGLQWSLAALLGAILCVSGPTVVNPILAVARPSDRVEKILLWEGTMLDPLGALAAVVIFQMVKASASSTSLGEGIAMFAFAIVAAVIATAFGTALFVIGGHLVRGNATLATQVMLGSVIVTSGLVNLISGSSGLLAALLLGIAAPRVAKRLGAEPDLGAPFFDTIVSIGIGILFVSISALVTLAAVKSVLVPALVMAVLLILVQRPLVAALCTRRAGLSRNERIFIGWMDPRGIVAAATASSAGAVLVSMSFAGAERLLPAAFIVIAVTVAVYGLTAAPVARLLHLRAS